MGVAAVVLGSFCLEDLEVDVDELVRTEELEVVVVVDVLAGF